jgi:four helix bundle protein
MKHPVRTKPQDSTPNTQGNFKQQASKSTRRVTSSTKYPESTPEALLLNDGPSGEAKKLHPFDLEKRTAIFGEAIVRFSKQIPRNPTNNRLIDQLVGAGTSVGANYCEATESLSKKDFRCSINRCLKEAKEAKFFLQMLAASECGLVEKARQLYREGNELHMIFASIFRKS